MAVVFTLTLNPALDVSARTAHVEPTHKLRCDAVERHPGGGGVNVARVLHRMGTSVQALVALGGNTGVLLEELLKAEGVDTLCVPIAGHTRESFTVLEVATGQEFRFVLPGPALAESEWQMCLDALAHANPWPALVVCSGSLPPGAPLDFYAQVARLCAQRGTRLIVDAAGPALQRALAAGVFLVKPSVGELRALSGLPLATLADVATAAHQFTQRGQATVVVVSMGSRGAMMVTAQSTHFAAALPVPVVSAVGAGDSFVAGMVYGLLESDDMCQAFRWGVAAASAALKSSGNSLCTFSDAQALRDQVQVQAGLPLESV